MEIDSVENDHELEGKEDSEASTNSEDSDVDISSEQIKMNVIEHSGCGSQVCKPYVGMVFQNDEEAFEYYNRYAALTGFGVRRGHIYKSKPNNNVTSRIFLCSKEGFKGNDKRRDDVKKPRGDYREGCTAYIKIKLREDNTWVVESLSEDHCHPCVSPSKVKNIRSHKKMRSATMSLIERLNQSIGPSKISSVLSALEGGDGVIVSKQDTKNHLKKVRKNNIGQECMNVIKSFMDKQAKDDGFFFEAQLDERHRMRSVFWADSRSRMAYQQFGDVLVFDTTYRTNTFLMPFAPFTGVNHHMQSTLFGCALLADETEGSFIWLFETWLKAMEGKRPVSIITDQCGAMAKAIAKVFPDSRHRYCLWHIGQNEIRHLNQIKSRNNNFQVDYDKWKYSQSVEEFETRWSQLLERYGLEEDSWLYNMYKIRQHWIPCYLRDTFFAGMSTTQRSESINAFFDGYVSARTPLEEFISQYDLALTHRRDQENYEDYMTMHTKQSLWSMSPLESQASKVYTRVVFERFQAEFRNKDTYCAKKCRQEGSIITYAVGKYGSDNLKCMVTTDEMNGVIHCSCMKFEFEGLLCAHILKVYQKIDVIEIPSQYILTRWTIVARYGHVRQVEGETVDPNKISPLMIWNLREAGLKSIDLGIQSMEHYKVAMQALGNLVENLDAIKLCPQERESIPEDSIGHDEGCVPLNEQLHIRILDPERAATKGRPKNTLRIRSGMEESMLKSKQRTCGHCKKKGHYATTCPEKKVMGGEAVMEDQSVISQMSQIMEGIGTQNNY